MGTAEAAVETPDRRFNHFDTTTVTIVPGRQKRPNLPSQGCPFCVGGLEAPEPYEVFAFANRWPALGPGRCEVVLYTPDHDSSFAALPASQAKRVVDLWAERTTALRNSVASPFVLIFENRGPEVGATMRHPHGQIYAFDHVPKRPHLRFQQGWRPDDEPGDRLVIETENFVVYTEFASVHPVHLYVAPKQLHHDLESLNDGMRFELAELLVDLNRRLDALFDEDLPYMMWINQAPVGGDGKIDATYPNPWLHIELVSPWRSKGVARFIAAAEVATEEYFNPVSPEDVAQRLAEL